MKTPELSPLADCLGSLLKERGIDPTNLARKLHRGDDYVRDLLNGRKKSLAVDFLTAVEAELSLEPGSLIAVASDRDANITRVPLGQEFSPDAPYQKDPDGCEATRRVSRKSLQPGEVPERDVTAGMGNGGLGPVHMVDGIEVDAVRAVWRIPVDYLRTELRSREGDVDFIPVDGDSMIPTLLPGDRVMINRSQTAPSPDGLFAIFDGIGISVKRLEVVKGSNPIRIRIKSDNPLHGPDEIMAADLNVIGRVVCKVTRL